MAEHVHGSMEIGAQERTFRGTVSFTIRSCILIAIVLALMAAFLT